MTAEQLETVRDMVKYREIETGDLDAVGALLKSRDRMRDALVKIESMDDQMESSIARAALRGEP